MENRNRYCTICHITTVHVEDTEKTVCQRCKTVKELLTVPRAYIIDRPERYRWI